MWDFKRKCHDVNLERPVLRSEVRKADRLRQSDIPSPSLDSGFSFFGIQLEQATVFSSALDRAGHRPTLRYYLDVISTLVF